MKSFQFGEKQINPTVKYCALESISRGNISVLHSPPSLLRHGHVRTRALTAASVSLSLDNLPQKNTVCRGWGGAQGGGEEGAEWASHESLLSELNGGSIREAESEGHLWVGH